MSLRFSEFVLAAALLFCAESLASVTFSKGYAVIGGRPVEKLDEISGNTVVHCPQGCQIRVDKETIIIRFGGFGPFSRLLALNPDETKRDSNASSQKGGAESKENDRSTDSKEKVTSEGSDDGVSVETPGLQADAEPEPEGFGGDQHSYVTPYPKDRTLFLHESGGRINIFPKKKCEGSGRVLVFFGEHRLLKREFDNGEAPVVFITFVESFEGGTISWTFEDEQSKIEGSFEINHTSQGTLGPALSEGRDVEIVE